MMEIGKYGREWHDDSSKEAPRNTPIRRVTIYIEQDPNDMWWKDGVDDDQDLGHCGGDAGI
jgi:hypothetical protein